MSDARVEKTLPAPSPAARLVDVDTADPTSDQPPAEPDVVPPTEPAPRRSRARVIAMVALALGLSAVVVVAFRVRRKVTLIGEVTSEIEADLMTLDPVERAAVVARLAQDTVRDVRTFRGH